MTTKRLRILHFDSGGGRSTFAQDVRRGLTAHPKFLLPKYFYDPLGSHLFEAICLLPEYYVTRAEHEILSAQSDAIVQALEGPHTLVELGSGSSAKTQLLIEALLRRQDHLQYSPIDISDAALTGSAKQLLQLFPKLEITAYSADYETALASLAERAGSRDRQERTFLIFLGSSIGNLDPPEARDLFSRIRRVLLPGDSFLLGADLKKSGEILVPAYDDALGVTAAFNLNLLVRINRELDGRFQLESFQHRAVYNERQGRIEMYLVSRVRQAVPIRALDLTVKLDRDELIHTESSYKFEIEALGHLAEATGFELVLPLFDQERRFSLSLFRATGSQ